MKILQSTIDLYYRLVESWRGNDYKRPTYGSLVHVKGKNPLKGFGVIKGKGQGPYPILDYWAVQYPGESVFIAERKNFFLIEHV